MSVLRRTVLSWLPVALYMTIIWIISSMSLGPLPIDAVPFRDKGIHFLEYSALALLVAHAAFRTWPGVARHRTFFVAIVVAVGWGVLDELHQSFVPGRSADVFDIVADTLGASAGASARVVVSFLLSRGAHAPQATPEPKDPEEPAAS